MDGGFRQDPFQTSNLDWMISRDLAIVSFSDGLSTVLPTKSDDGGYHDLESIIHADDRARVIATAIEIEWGERQVSAIQFRLAGDPDAQRTSAVALRCSHEDQPAVLFVLDPTPRSVDPPSEWKQHEQEEWESALGDETLFRWTTDDPPHLANIGTSVFWLTGFSRDELLSSPEIFNTLPHPADMQVHASVFENPGPDPFDVKLRWRHRDGSERWIQIAGAPHDDAEEGVSELRGSIRDITDQVNMQVMDRVRTAALRAAANAVVITRADGVIEWVNPAFTTLTGFTRNEAIGNNPSILRSGEHDDDFYTSMWETIKAGDVWKGELVNRRKDGSTYHEEQTITPVRDFTGKVSRFIAIKQDISERKEQENQLILATKKAKEASAFKSNLLNNVSHEVLTPLAAILGLSDIIRDESEDELKEFAIDIHRNGARLRETLANVLDLSRIQSNDFALGPEWLSSRDIAEGVLKRFESLVDPNRVTMRFSTDDKPIWMDQRALRRILTNLISNAIKFTDDGVITIDIRLEGKEVTIVVNDTGCGVDRAFIPVMCDEFRQESDGLNRQHAGTGLGLSVVKRLTRLLHGSVEIVSQKHLGTSVTVRVPHFVPEASKAMAST